jgi:hypothetical protein
MNRLETIEVELEEIAAAPHPLAKPGCITVCMLSTLIIGLMFNIWLIYST